MARGRGQDEVGLRNGPHPILDAVGFRLFWEQATPRQRQNYVWPKNLDYADLSGLDLSSIDLRGVSLYEVNLSNANLTNAQLDETELRDLNTENALLDTEDAAAIKKANPKILKSFAEALQEHNPDLKYEEELTQEGSKEISWLNKDGVYQDPVLPELVPCPKCDHPLNEPVAKSFNRYCQVCKANVPISGAASEIYLDDALIHFEHYVDGNPLGLSQTRRDIVDSFERFDLAQEASIYKGVYKGPGPATSAAASIRYGSEDNPPTISHQHGPMPLRLKYYRTGGVMAITCQGGDISKHSKVIENIFGISSGSEIKALDRHIQSMAMACEKAQIVPYKYVISHKASAIVAHHNGRWIKTIADDSFRSHLVEAGNDDIEIKVAFDDVDKSIKSIEKFYQMGMPDAIAGAAGYEIEKIRSGLSAVVRGEKFYRLTINQDGSKELVSDGFILPWQRKKITAQLSELIKRHSDGDQLLWPSLN